MSLPGVLERGDEVLNQFDRRNPFWNFSSHATCLLAVGWSKLVLYTSYKPKITGLEILDQALEKSQKENRGIMTIMNHMSVVDDPFLWGCLPWRFYRDIDHIRWGLGAHNVCFQNKFLTYFFSLGKILPTERFGVGPFQSSLDAAIRIMSPDDSLNLVYDGTEETNTKWVNPAKQELNKITPLAQISKEYISPIIRSKPSWIHVFPEGFVLQLQQPFQNSMRYFKWGITRIILESTRQPIIIPIFSTGFEKIAPESAAGGGLLERFLPANFGTEINITIGNPIDDKIIENFRKEWLDLVQKHLNSGEGDLNDELKFGKAAQALRSKISSELRKAVLEIRNSTGMFPPEDSRFKDHKFWHDFTKSEGESAPEVKFIGQNWAIRRLQKFLKEHDEYEMSKKHEEKVKEEK
ncbi:Lysophosphatidylcholine acyltransferase [Wickerhamomyces ciferrii]|uniref:Tafazzin family protein n=1 Tax=Wickerhamomyces ciferrii (strain ATCC 14091 / BCRC 22168 / CBS 111 / JCM 3599 / NBRC 0793 / NRRL Y-1031 F-60-10) TaxID=1206466 RepID=K0KKZ0_WICCF|nr:Lysophosphatidylcholine acyltransferase [Wickerhamomyces ciferrii]CCH42817.1 Lysophosphatidylcholine acyltransferase [Wickerhamomyces ciferrii]